MKGVVLGDKSNQESQLSCNPDWGAGVVRGRRGGVDRQRGSNSRNWEQRRVMLIKMINE